MKISLASGCLPLFRVAGIQVFLHWSWFFAAAVLVQLRVSRLDQSSTQALLDVIALFAIVLLHEFGHALACRSVGGKANTIVLWPLGGVAFVKPPPRPGPILWSIAAGPLVNVAIVPMTLAALLWLDVPMDLANFSSLSGMQQMVLYLTLMNLVLLIFNMLPIYPLDGGQMLQAILWFFVGRALSLKITAAIGVVGAVVGGLLALMSRPPGRYYMLFMAVFVGWQAINGLRTARALALLEKVRDGDVWRTPADLEK